MKIRNPTFIRCHLQNNNENLENLKKKHFLSLFHFYILNLPFNHATCASLRQNSKIFFLEYFIIKSINSLNVRGKIGLKNIEKKWQTKKVPNENSKFRISFFVIWKILNLLSNWVQKSQLFWQEFLTKIFVVLLVPERRQLTTY